MKQIKLYKIIEKRGRRRPQRKNSFQEQKEVFRRFAFCVLRFEFRNDVLHGHHHQGQRSRASHPRRRHPRRRCRRFPFPQAIVVGVAPASFRTRGDLFPPIRVLNSPPQFVFYSSFFFLQLDSIECAGVGDLLESFSLDLD